MPDKKQRRLGAFLLLTGSVVLASLAFAIWGDEGSAPSAESHTIVLTAAGFEPQRLDAREGDTVVFRNERSEPFWPASMPHLTHTSYKSFDARRPFSAGETWRFVLTRAGTWEYHDHLDESAMGTIVVEENPTFVLGDCDAKEERSLLIQCWAEELEATLAEGGVGEAFTLLGELHDEGNPTFLANCHDYAHIIGEATYHLLAEGQDFTVAPEAALCGFGFYHGFMETMLWTSGDFDEAKAFCQSLNERFSKIASGAAPSCYHGIGHGAAEVHDPQTWGDELAMMEPAIGICEKSTKTPQQLSDCIVGAFMAVSTFYTTGEYDLTIREDDPMWICREQEGHYRQACYNSMPIALMWLADMDIAKAASYFDGVPRHLAIGAVGFFAGPYIYADLGNTDYTDGIQGCQSLDEELVWPCLKGFPNSLKEIGGPGSEHERVFLFCDSSALTDGERSRCYEHVLTVSLPPLYSEESFAELCRNEVPERYRTFCGVTTTL